MCIVFVAIEQHPRYPLIIAANRDEFFNRPTLPSHVWGPSRNIVAGIDQEAGGTWMGVNKAGYLAALTNIRAPQTLKPHVKSRGELVSHYLQQPTTNYQQALEQSRQDFNGYNLLFGHWKNLYVYNNHLNHLTHLKKGFYGLSNASLNSPWPKIVKGLARLKTYCENTSQDPEHIIDKQLFELLRDPNKANENELPRTGIPMEWERKLSSIFIQADHYGTRASTVLKIDTNQKVSWCEHTYNSGAVCISEQNYQFDIN